MHSDGLKNSKTVAKIANTKPGVNNESTSVQSGHNAVNSCKECNGTGQMPQSPDDVAIPEHCDRRKSEDQSTSLRAIGSELNDTKSKTEILLENTNVKASEKISSSDVPNLHADFSFSGDFAGINPNRNAEEE
ncbi:uncharacterized protein LOC127701104 [Mytilus californianus]|uniref:uncharacterized protein LOC127701104 n=1 Tax=Mytilus californianus TaxID=6549 RepID=UPI0022479484|nr:uncharacterized protein LOC127701104 [Mytilus californianus]